MFSKNVKFDIKARAFCKWKKETKKFHLGKAQVKFLKLVSNDPTLM
jgi:hypothetical protein